MVEEINVEAVNEEPANVISVEVEMNEKVEAVKELERDIEIATEKMMNSAISLYDSWYANLELKAGSWTNINGFMKARSASEAVLGDWDPDMAIALANHMAEVYEDAVVYFATPEPEEKFGDIKQFAGRYNEYLAKLYDPELTKKEFDPMRYAVELLSMQLCQDVDDVFGKLKELIDYSEGEIEKTREELRNMK